MKINIISIFPDAFDAFKVSVLKRALDDGILELNIINPRDFSKNKHKKVDDTPFGGGAGMIMTPQPLHDAIISIDPEHKMKRIYLSPSGEKLNQNKVIKLSKSKKDLILVCGNYEGIDHRIVEMHIDEEISIGDYVLTGGELPAMVLVNAVSRYISGVLGSSKSLDKESFSTGLLEYRQYTKPQNFLGYEVPEVLLSGNHQEIEKWRLNDSINITKLKRPDLLEEKK